MKKIYKVMQGHFTASGSGDEWKDSEYTNKDDAIRRMKAISKDAKDLCGKTKGGYLLTSVWVAVEGDADNDDECIVEDSYECIAEEVYHY